MKYTIKVVRHLETDNGKEFDVGQDIAFSMYGENKEIDRYIGRIKKITSSKIVIVDIEINGKSSDKERMVIPLEDIVKNSCSYVYYD